MRQLHYHTVVYNLNRWLCSIIRGHYTQAHIVLKVAAISESLEDVKTWTIPLWIMEILSNEMKS